MIARTTTGQAVAISAADRSAVFNRILHSTDANVVLSRAELNIVNLKVTVSHFVCFYTLIILSSDNRSSGYGTVKDNRYWVDSSIRLKEDTVRFILLKYFWGDCTRVKREREDQLGDNKLNN